MSGLRRSHPAALALLAVFALALRLLVPSGWMPVAEGGAVSIMLCTGNGPVAIVMERDGSLHEKSPRAPQEPRDPCPYGLALAKALAPVSAWTMPLPPALLAELVLPMPAAARLAAWPALRPPARGPPTLA